MLASQRLNRIREIFIEREYADIPSLSLELGVSEITIRRDFEKLSKEGFIKKTYGGAMLSGAISALKATPYLTDIAVETEDEMELIAKIAIHLIQDGDLIFLGGGVPSRYVARALPPSSNITVVTNDVFVASELWNKANIKVSVTGGEMVPNTGYMLGSRTMDSISGVFFTKVFIDVAGIHLENGFTVDSIEESRLYRCLLDHAEQKLALADFRRFGRTGHAMLGGLTLFDSVVTNKELPEEFKSRFFNDYIKLYTTYDIT